MECYQLNGKKKDNHNLVGFDNDVSNNSIDVRTKYLLSVSLNPRL
jgi:hypothetical protein